MICLNGDCDSEEFRPSVGRVWQVFNGADLLVETPVMLCSKCGWRTIGNDQIDELRKRTQAEYDRTRTVH